MKEQRFRSTLVRGDRALGWTIALIPFDPHRVWKKMVRLRVCGEISGPRGSCSFRTSLFPEPGKEGQGAFFLLVNRTMQASAGAMLGEVADFVLRPDLEERRAELPEELDALLDESEGLRAWYGELSEYTRRQLGKYIDQASGDESRMRRVEQTAERMLNTMEAEAELPPLLSNALRARPKALQGWKTMTPAQRRGELFAVFYYQSPEARGKRLAKLLDSAEKRAAKHSA